MRPSVRLIEALRRAATRIEVYPQSYDWGKPQQCNCGQVVAQLIEPAEMYRLMYVASRVMGAWTNRADGGYCNVTGLPADELFKVLSSFGFEKPDFRNIELCRAREVLNRLGATWTTFDYEEPANVSRYLRAQADLLEEQLRQEQKPQPSKPACAHLPMFGLCVYCGHVEPVATPVKEGV